MNKFTILSIFFSLLALLLTSSIHAEGYIKKEVYSFKDAQGNVVFTDRKPNKKKSYETQIIEAANSTGNTQTMDSPQYKNTVNVYRDTTQTVRIIVDTESTTKKKSKTKRRIRNCKTYKKKFTYYSDKMKAGYKNSEFKKLESNRKKYKNLLFDKCPTKTFDD